MKRIVPILALILLCGLAAPALAQGTLAPERMMVLVVGPSTRSVHPDEAEAVQRLNQLRRQNGLDRMKLGTMHYDQQAQARFCRDVLGIQKSDLVAVALVELDGKGNPKRSLYTIPRVTAEDLDRLQGTITKWSQLSGIPLRSPAAQDQFPVRDEQLSSEGMLNTARRLEDLSAELWDRIRNEPLRQDQSDRSVRRAVLGLAENARLLRTAFEQGRVNPVEQFDLVLGSGQQWKASEPQFTLPVKYRYMVPSIDEALGGVQQAYRQLNGGR